MTAQMVILTPRVLDDPVVNIRTCTIAHNLDHMIQVHGAAVRIVIDTSGIRLKKDIQISCNLQ